MSKRKTNITNIKGEIDSKTIIVGDFNTLLTSAAAAAKSLQLCPTLCDPIDGSPPGSPRPWDSPGKNTGVGCHFFLQCMKVKSESEVAQSCPTQRPHGLSTPGSSVHGILQARILEWVAISFPRRSSQPRDQTHVSCMG